MVLRWFTPQNGERRRLLTLHIWSYGSSCYGALNDEDYIWWFINDANLKVQTAHWRTRGTVYVEIFAVLNFRGAPSKQDFRDYIFADL